MFLIRQCFQQPPVYWDGDGLTEIRDKAIRFEKKSTAVQVVMDLLYRGVKWLAVETT